MLSGWFNYGFKLGLMKKDVDIAVDLLDEHFPDSTVIRNTQKQAPPQPSNPSRRFTLLLSTHADRKLSGVG